MSIGITKKDKDIIVVNWLNPSHRGKEQEHSNLLCLNDRNSSLLHIIQSPSQIFAPWTIITYVPLPCYLEIQKLYIIQ